MNVKVVIDDDDFKKAAEAATQLFELSRKAGILVGTLREYFRIETEGEISADDAETPPKEEG